MSFSVAFVAGVTPDKWVGVWRRRRVDVPLDLLPVDVADQREVLFDGRADVSFVRMPVDREGLHCIPLYREVPVVVVPAEHVATAYDEVDIADLADEQLVYGDVPGWAELAQVEQLDFPPMSLKDAVEVVASGTGIVVVPMSLARLHHRKDVAYRPVTGVPDTQVGLAWRVDADDERIEEWIGIVRGRTENSSRGEQAAKPKQAAKQPPPKKRPAKKQAPARGKPRRRR